MTSLADTAPRSLTERRFAVCLLILVALTVVRLIGLTYSEVDLFFDESQYWAWSRELAFGYFSKPPLLAWVIAGAEAICGSAEACIRAPSPVLYLGSCLVSYAIAKALYDEATAFWAALLFAFTAGVAFSSRIISTDVPMLFFWALALLAYVKLLQGGDWRWGVVLGVSFGLGMLAKYAMIYFLLGIAAAAVIDRDARALLRSRALWLAAAIAVALILPNAIWNAQNGFVTLTHVGHNIQGEGAAFNPLRGLEFVASQFAVFGPVTFSVLLIVCVRMFKPDIGRADRLMLCFALPTLALVTVTAFVTRANANWAAAAFISANILVAAVLVRLRGLALDRAQHRDRRRRADRAASPPTPMRAGCRSRGSPSPTSMRAPWAGARSARRSTSSRARPAPGPSPRNSATSSRRCSITRATPAGRCCHGRRAQFRTIIST